VERLLKGTFSPKWYVVGYNLSKNETVIFDPSDWSNVATTPEGFSGFLEPYPGHEEVQLMRSVSPYSEGKGLDLWNPVSNKLENITHVSHFISYSRLPGNRIITEYFGNFNLWDLVGWKLIRTFQKVGRRGVYSFLPHGEVAEVRENKVYVFDPLTSTTRLILNSENNSYTGYPVPLSNYRLLVPSEDQTFIIWDLSNGKLLSRGRFSFPAGRVLEWGPNTLLVLKKTHLSPYEPDQVQITDEKGKTLHEPASQGESLLTPWRFSSLKVVPKQNSLCNGESCPKGTEPLLVGTYNTTTKISTGVFRLVEGKFQLVGGEVENYPAGEILPYLVFDVRVLRCVLKRRMGKYLPNDLLGEVWNFFAF